MKILVLDAIQSHALLCLSVESGVFLGGLPCVFGTAGPVESFSNPGFFAGFALSVSEIPQLFKFYYVLNATED